MAADVAEFLWNKSLNALQEAETEFSQLNLASHFEGIKKVLESQNKNICSSSASNICEVLYELNDILTECRIFAQQRKLFKKNWVHFNQYTENRFVRKRKTRLVRVKEDFDKMVERCRGSSECNTPKSPGLNEYVEKIENILFKDDADVGYKAVGICGMGGTGKTKLARDIFDREKVNSRFSKRIWLCLSNIQRNDRDTVREKILELVKTEAGESTFHELGINDSDEPLDILHRILQCESCLVVFDDVWPWHAEILGKKTLSGGLRDGAAVIITSRLPRVARRVARRMGCLNLNLIPLEPPLYHGKICERTPTCGISDGSSIIGFQSCVRDIESKLCEGGFKIIGISGMCGTGKTTLAREIFNDKSVSAAFSTKIWVCLSGIKSNETNIGIQILKLVLNELDYNIDELMTDKHDMAELLGTIHLLISHEKYLIVFDDVWPWHANFLAAEINSAGGLPRGSGGAVIVTTRLKKVARRIGGENMIDLQPPLLEGEDCGKIVEDTLGGIDTSKVFDDVKWNKIKYEIRYQSHGLPFAAKILGEIFLEKIQRSSEIS
ncbi:DISEASE RESISTANCE PROTEIN RP [Salix purpurea]|uniref:DISEASE RESISTANCE PROTEIN RP n=2 Tax=Salix purpurea TaxID=77065 RepID=A0A9Q0ZRD5_SALPP|nr:DISEASE RESISTANCE PROTEIN RP [Salix purpurea]